MKLAIRTTLALGLCAAVWACGGGSPDADDDDNDDDTSSPDGGGGSDGDSDGSGGNGPSDDDDGSGGSDSSDEPPTVVSVEVGGQDATSALVTGIEDDATIVITFSEPMDKSVTAAAYGSADAPITAANVTTDWNSAGTVLTITPNELLPYKDVGLPDLPADVFTFQINTAAKDKQGQELEEKFEASFSPFKKVTQFIAPTVGNSAWVAYLDKSPAPEAMGLTRASCPYDESFQADLGYSEDAYYPGSPGRNEDNGGARAAIYSFDLGSVPTSQLISANLSLAIFERSDASVLWTDLDVQALSVRQLETQALSADTVVDVTGPNISPTEDPIGAAGDYGTYHYGVKDQAATSIDNSDGWFIFRLGFNDLTGTGPTEIVCTSLSLTLVYLTE